jgi:hypothetical protein
VKRRLLWLLCTTIVAAIQLHPAAAVAVSEDVPLPGGTAALSRALGVDPAPDRGRFLFEITRLVYDTPEGRRPSADAFLQAVRQATLRGRRDAEPDPRPAELVPVPLSAELWSSAIFHRKVAREELVVAIIADRTAALMCHGLAALDDQTLEFFAEHPALLTRIYERSAPLFAAFSDSLHIRANRVVPPGGEGAAPLWESVLLEKVTRPDRFVLQLLELNDGRIAYLYDSIAQLDPPRRAFTLGLWLPNAADRLERFRLLTLALNGIHEWHVRAMPFGRSSYDLMMMLARIPVDEQGAPQTPASRGFWLRVFGGVGLPDDASRQALPAGDDDPFDAAWLTDTIAAADVRQRSERLDQLTFGARVFAGAAAADRADVFVALRALPRYRMLLWTLERIGVTAPSVYATAARQAARLGTFDGRRGFELQSQFQGALALVARMTAVRTIDTAAAQRLIARLVALPISDQGRYAGGVAAWLRDDVAAALRPAETVETRILAAMSGPASGERSPPAPIVWEGQAYRLDLGASELRRLRRVREKQEGIALDVALEMAAVSRALAVDKTAIADVTAILARLTRLAEDVPQRSRHDEEDNLASGLGATSSPHDQLRKTIDDLTKAERARDVKRAARLAEPLGDLADQLLGQVLLSFAYAAHVGDPEGTVLLAGDVSHRHDFGLGARESEVRLRTAWAIPRQDVSPGQPWHVTGSLLGLDVGLAPLVLRRVNFERVLEAPKLTSNQRDAFAVSVSLMDPLALRDADRDTIVNAVARGRRRVQDLKRDGADLDPLADELGLEGWRRRALRWTLANESARVPALLTLTELLTLGGGRTADLDAWGMGMLTTQGCLCTRLTPPGRWPTLLGRPQLGLTASGVADLNLHVAMLLKELQLPAALAKVVLSGAVQDFIDEVKPTDDGDWLTLARAARTVTRERVEDYIAAATAAGPLVPDTGRPAS